MKEKPKPHGNRLVMDSRCFRALSNQIHLCLYCQKKRKKLHSEGLIATVAEGGAPG